MQAILLQENKYVLIFSKNLDNMLDNATKMLARLRMFW
jgi:hypothetical protein